MKCKFTYILSFFLGKLKIPYFHEKNWRNVGLFFNVYKQFFQEILDEKHKLNEDLVNSYLSILASRPNMTGMRHVHLNIGITSCGFMVRM